MKWEDGGGHPGHSVQLGDGGGGSGGQALRILAVTSHLQGPTLLGSMDRLQRRASVGVRVPVLSKCVTSKCAMRTEEPSPRGAVPRCQERWPPEARVGRGTNCIETAPPKGGRLRANTESSPEGAPKYLCCHVSFPGGSQHWGVPTGHVLSLSPSGSPVPKAGPRCPCPTRVHLRLWHPWGRQLRSLCRRQWQRGPRERWPGWVACPRPSVHRSALVAGARVGSPGLWVAGLVEDCEHPSISHGVNGGFHWS